jgi:hypothetical protein
VHIPGIGSSQNIVHTISGQFATYVICICNRKGLAEHSLEITTLYASRYLYGIVCDQQFQRSVASAEYKRTWRPCLHPLFNYEVDNNHCTRFIHRLSKCLHIPCLHMWEEVWGARSV